MNANESTATEGKALVDFGESEFRARPEFEGHLGRALLVALLKSGSQEIIVDRTGERRTMTGRMLAGVALALAGKLRRVPESRVGIVLPPCIGGYIANMAVVFAGKIPVNLNFTIGRAAIEASIKKAGLTTILSSKIFREKITARIPDIPWTERVLYLEEEICPMTKAKAAMWMTASRMLPAGVLAGMAGIPHEGGDREAGLLFTSGSSGEPKGVVLTHRNILGNCAQIDASGILPKGETLLANLPIFHSFGFTITLWYAILRGVRVVTLPSPLEVRKCVEAIKAEGVSVTVGTPTFLRPYIKKAEAAEMATMKLAVAGAEKTPAGFHEEWEKKFGGEYCEGYGMTETSPVIAVNLPARLTKEHKGPLRKAGSVGRLFPGMAARVVDTDTGRDLGFNETGMLWLKGVNVFPGYLEQPEATAETLRGPWIVTGDLVKVDEEGFIFIQGRLSRFSKLGGEMVPHGTVEAAVAKALGIEAAETPVIAIAARHDAAKGEALVLLTTMEINAEDLRNKLSAAGLPNLWAPRIVKRVEAIPLLASGKLDLRKLRELAAE